MKKIQEKFMTAALGLSDISIYISIYIYIYFYILYSDTFLEIYEILA